MNIKNSKFDQVFKLILVVFFLTSLGAFIISDYAARPDKPAWWTVVLNIIILSIPLSLLYEAIYVVVKAWREHRQSGRVPQDLAKLIHWSPRLASILIIFFISLFSLDVFDMEGSALELLGGFLIHNIPSFIMIILLIFAWKRPVIGFVAFLISGVLFTIFFVQDFNSLPNLLLFVLPILLIASLFYMDWKWLGHPQSG